MGMLGKTRTRSLFGLLLGLLIVSLWPGVALAGTFTTGATWTNPGQVNIPDASPGAPYPSSIVVSGLTGKVSKVIVSLLSLNHSFPDDIDILLEGPEGQSVVLMSDVGWSADALGLTLTFADSATASLEFTTQLVSGIFRPTNVGVGADVFPTPAPVGPYGAELSVFRGTGPNGVWSLYVVDDEGQDIGTLAGGWSLNIFTENNPCYDTDFDGDGREDFGVYRTTTGEWFIRRSSDGQMMQVYWGAPDLGDIPVPGDYDGDCKADIAVFRKTTGEWFVRRSSDGGLTYLPWGSPFLRDLPLKALGLGNVLQVP